MPTAADTQLAPTACLHVEIQCRKWKQRCTSVCLISNFRRVLNVVRFLLGNSPASESCMPNVSEHRVCSIFSGTYEDGTDSVLKCRHIKFRRQGITQNKAYGYFCLVYHIPFPKGFFSLTGKSFQEGIRSLTLVQELCHRTAYCGLL